MLSSIHSRPLPALLAAALVAATPAVAADFYENKTVTLIVGNDAGTGFDGYGRLLARHMPKYLAGKPNIIVQNMNGAGSVIAAQFLYNAAPRDGTVFGVLTPGAIADPLFEPAKFRYDPVKFEHLGTAESLTRLCFTSAASAAKTYADARNAKVLIGGTAPGNSTSDYAVFLNSVTGSKFEIVNGYKSSGELLLAMERGEVEGVCALDVSAVATLRPDWIGSGKVNFLVQVGFQPNEAMTKLGIPTFWNFVAPEHRAIAELYVTQQVFGRPFVAPPGVPQAQLRELRAAFMAAYRDPELLAEAKRMKLEVNPIGGEEIAATVTKLYSADRALVQRLAAALKN